MKIRYYLRGLGLGILITAVFFLLGDNSGRTMSDEMIKERAKELGMVESTVLADIDESVQETEESISTQEMPEESITETAEIATEETSEEVSEVVATTEVVSEEESTTAEEETEEITSKEESVEETPSEETTEESVPTGQMISIVVNRGEGSDTVSQRLYEAGLIEDPHEYDRYLMQNGYDKRIGAGEHMVPMGADWQEIAKILTS